MTSFQLEPSAKAPCSRTMVGLACLPAPVASAVLVALLAVPLRANAPSARPAVTVETTPVTSRLRPPLMLTMTNPFQVFRQCAGRPRRLPSLP